MRHAATVLLILTVTIFSGCSQECKPVLVPQKCVVPQTPEPTIDYEPCADNDYGCIVSKSLKNYEAQKNYARELKINSEVCR